MKMKWNEILKFFMKPCIELLININKKKKKKKKCNIKNKDKIKKPKKLNIIKILLKYL